MIIYEKWSKFWEPDKDLCSVWGLISTISVHHPSVLVQLLAFPLPIWWCPVDKKHGDYFGTALPWDYCAVATGARLSPRDGSHPHCIHDPLTLSPPYPTAIHIPTFLHPNSTGLCCLISALLPCGKSSRYPCWFRQPVVFVLPLNPIGKFFILWRASPVWWNNVAHITCSLWSRLLASRPVDQQQTPPIYLLSAIFPGGENWKTLFADRCFLGFHIAPL